MDHQAQSHEETNSAELVYNCDLCEFTSNIENGIKIHKSAKHDTIAPRMEVNVDQENYFDNFEDDDGPYHCNYCERNHVQTVYHKNDFNNLIRHIQNDHVLNTVWGPLNS